MVRRPTAALPHGCTAPPLHCRPDASAPARTNAPPHALPKYPPPSLTKYPNIPAAGPWPSTLVSPSLCRRWAKVGKVSVKNDTKALDLIYDPDEYLCTWSVPDGEGGWRALSGSVDARANRPPRGQVYGNVPLRSSSTTPGESVFTFPQHVKLPVLQASLANGGALILLDAEISYLPGSGRISGSAALLGKGNGLFGQVTSVFVEASERSVPRVTSARFQIAALDAVLGTVPIHEVAIPGISGAPTGQWTARTNPDASVEWTSDDATLHVGYVGRMRAMDRYEFGMRFSPVATLNLTDGVTLRELVDDYVEPLRRIIAIATGQSRDLTSLAVQLDGETGWFQVFGSAIIQQPFESSSQEVQDTSTAILAHGDEVSLLDLIIRWRQLESEHHPLVETYGSMLHAVDQHPRSRFLLLIQALEGMHGAETREQNNERAAKHTTQRTSALEKLKGLTDEDLPAEHRRFMKDNLSKWPPSSLDSALAAMAKALPVNGMDALAKTTLVKDLLASKRATSTADALRLIRNDLAHGNRGYEFHELNEVVVVLEQIVRGHALRLLGCPELVITRVFDGD